MSVHHSAAYQRLEQMFAEDRCVMLDGGIATELQRVGIKNHPLSDKDLWGTGALYHAPQIVLEVHQHYAEAQCDVISTNTWAILSAPEIEAPTMVVGGAPSHWMDGARLAIKLAREAVERAGKAGHCAVAFSINGDINSPERQATLQLLTRVFEEDPPDLILLETLSLVRENVTFPVVQMMLDTGLPVWISFRRCRHGVCGVHGQHWGGPEGDLFGHAAQRFEAMGVGALMINCLPASHIPGMLPWLRDFTDMPLGVYPNLGRYLDPGWKFDERVGPDEYARMALSWRGEGAQVVGGCCGVMPEHLAAARQILLDTKPGRPRATALPVVEDHDVDAVQPLTSPAVVQPWLDEKGRSLSPLAFPDMRVDPGVFEPTEGSFLIWKQLFRTGIGQDQRCLDVGCGCGILAIQLALNGARHVDAIDIQREAVANAMANAFRNGVDGRVHAEVDDVFTFTTEEPYDLIVASLYQMPVDPYGEISGHRPTDYWGRNLLDHLIDALPSLLAADGVAYLMQLSILSQIRTAELLDRAGLEARVVDFDTFSFSPVFLENIEQIRRVENLSDAYHLTLEKTEVMVTYLLEITHKSGGSDG